MPQIDAEIQVYKEGKVVYRTRLGTNALLIGRAPDNDLILSDGRVSGRHAIFHLSADRSNLVVRDLGSTNGTFVNGDRVTGSAQVRDGDEVLLGSNSVLKVRLLEVDEEPGSLPIFPALLVDLHTGVAVGVRERMKVGSAEDSDLRIPGIEALHASITLHDEGAEIWVGTEDEEFPVVVGVPFMLAGRDMVFRDSKDAWQATQRESGLFNLYPYRLTVDAHLDEAIIEHVRAEVKHVVSSERRVALLYVLGRRRHEDLEGGTRPSQAGWLDDVVIMSEVWGRAGSRMTANNYQVLLSRLRKEIRQAGLDAWFIEKRQGHTRVRLDDIRLG